MTKPSFDSLSSADLTTITGGLTPGQRKLIGGGIGVVVAAGLGKGVNAAIGAETCVGGVVAKDGIAGTVIRGLGLGCEHNAPAAK